MSKKTLHFTVVEAEGEPFGVMIGHNPNSANEFIKNRNLSPSIHKSLKAEIKKACKVAEENDLAYVASWESRPTIHLLPKFLDYKNIPPEDVIAHESLHLTLNKIDEVKASYEYDYLRRIKGKEVWKD